MQKTVGDLIANLSDQTFRRQGKLLPLTPKAASILTYLVEKAGRPVSREELTDVIWPGRRASAEALKVHIFELRRVLGDDAKRPHFIETVPRRGYRLIAPVAGAAETSRNVSDFIDREEIIQQLFDALQQSRRGTRQFVFLSGEAGMGKSALIQEFLSRLSRQSSIRVGRGHAKTSDQPQDPFSPLLEALPNLGLPDLWPALAIHAPDWLTRLTSPAPSRLEIARPGERMLREICELLEAISASDLLVLVLEDLQWADGATIDFLSACARRTETARLLLLATFRDASAAHVDPPIAVLSRELSVKQLSSSIVLRPLSYFSVRRMLADSLGDLQLSSRFVHQVASYTGGNPLFVQEIREQLQQEGRIRSGSGEPLDYSTLRLTITRPLQETILWDFLSLSATQQTILECATQVRLPFSAWAVSLIAHIPEEKVLRECEALSREPGVLQPAGLERLSLGRCSECFKFRVGLYGDVVATRVEPSVKRDNQAVLAMERERLAKAGE